MHRFKSRDILKFRGLGDIFSLAIFKGHSVSELIIIFLPL
ncbi:unnamed protein product, partial [Allacma fusca]